MVILNTSGNMLEPLNIALVGYGKMGRAIQETAIQRGHKVILKIDVDSKDQFTKQNLQQCDVAIEFTNPHSAVENILTCLQAGVPVISGSTGWLAAWENVKQQCEKVDGALIYASNYSIGVNIFFEVNKMLARLMNMHADYEVTMEETHHTEKKDAPSGTAITLAEQIIDNINRKNGWVNKLNAGANEIAIISERIDPAPGTHKIKYSSTIDDVEIIHTAHNRRGFANGAVLAAEFIKGKKGIYSMKDVLGF